MEEKPQIINPQKLARIMKNTFFPFFSKWGNFNRLQLKAIPEILSEKNVVLISGTGSGKTRAIIAPIIELLIKEKRGEDLFLFICPTKALVNDTYKRISSPLESMNLSLGRKTGDFPFKEKLMQTAKGLIITIEGVDSLLTSRPEFFERVRFVICDEVHLVDGTPRGDHLRVLLQRVKFIRKGMDKKINFFISSATITNPSDLANRYFFPNVIIQDESKKYIELHLLKYSNTIFLTLEKFMVNNKLRKGIVFCNTRKSAERSAEKAKKLIRSFQIYVHHASLSKNQRESVEDSMNFQKYGICFATMTLELGIDIGGVDLIILNGTPPNVSSFLQRIGRGSRRRKDRSLVMCWYNDPFEELIYQLYYRLAIRGEFDRIRYFPRYSVCIQQIFSIAKQFYENGFTKELAISFLSPLISITDLDSVLNHLIEKNCLFFRERHYFPTTKLSDRIQTHTIYSNISLSLPFGDIEVRNFVNNEIIGYVSFSAAIKGKEILLAGKKWKVENLGRNKIYVSLIQRKSELPTYFLPKQIKSLISFFVAQEFKKQILSRKSFKTTENKMIMYPVTKNGGKFVIFHFLGSYYGFLFSELLKENGITRNIPTVNGIFIVCRQLDIEKLINQEYLHFAEDIFNESLSRLIPFLNLGPYYRMLPQDIQDKNVKESLDFETFWEIISLTQVELSSGEIIADLSKVFGIK